MPGAFLQTKNPFRRLKVVIIIFLVIAAMLAFLNFGGSDEIEGNPPNRIAVTPEYAETVLKPFVNGMSVTEVETLLGKPGIGPKPWRGGTTRLYFQFTGGLRFKMNPFGFVKQCNTIQAEFDPQNKLTKITLHGAYWSPVFESPF